MFRARSKAGKRRANVEYCVYVEGKHVGGRCNRKLDRVQDKVEADDPLWRPLMKAAKRSR